MPKILIIGQALPAVKQSLPYDTTMLYDWLNECGISKQDAQSIFEFHAVYGSFTGFDNNGGHLKPNVAQMNQYWNDILETKIQLTDKVWVLGNVARDYISTQEKTWSCNMEWLYTIHPSKRNWNLYIKNKEQIIDSIKSFIK